MKKTLTLVLPVFIFLPSLLYLHQKVQIHIEAYRLSNNYYRYNELVDKRDSLMYNLAKEVSLAKVNQWAQVKNFASVGKEQMLALSVKQQKQISRNKITSLFNRFLRASVSTSAALAKEKK